MPYDQIEKIGTSLVQHGTYNNRIYLMKLDPTETNQVLDRLQSIASKNRYDRIIAKIPKRAVKPFSQSGFKQEAEIPAFYSGLKSAVFMAKNLNPERAVEKDQNQREKVLNIALDCTECRPTSYSNNYQMRKTGSENVEQITALYQKVFKTYPFPIIEEDYILKTMDTNVRYFAFFDGEKIISIASTEMDKGSRNVEMTDFATDPDYRRNGLASRLLFNMERIMIIDGFLTAYTICRAKSYGMNLVFAKNSYSYGGTLINNTNISGQIESMNIWHKQLINLK